MTTVVIDLVNGKIVTDSRCTEYCAQRYEMSLFNKKVELPFLKKKFVRYNDEFTLKSIRIVKNGFTEFLCGSGLVKEINEFFDAYKADKIPSTFLKNSSVFVIKFDGHEWLAIKYNKSMKYAYTGNPEWITTGSGSELAAGAIDMLSPHDKNRAIKATHVAMNRDNSSGGEVQVLNIEEFGDLY